MRRLSISPSAGVLLATALTLTVVLSAAAAAVAIPGGPPLGHPPLAAASPGGLNAAPSTGPGPISRSGAPVSNPANCSQGSHSILLPAKTGDEHNAILSAYDTLGAEGGGTLYLGAGTFTVDESLEFQDYSNVTIQGAGMGKTILSVPVDPVGNFSADNGTAVGQYNLTDGGPVNGTTANFLEVYGPTPIDNFELCSLSVDGQANSAAEDWAGSLIFDNSGGTHHVYSDVSEIGFFGPSTTPNGLHLEAGANNHAASTGYVIDGLYASDNTVPFENFTGYRGGPNFLNVGSILNCTLDHVSGIGLAAFEVAPPRGCLMENWDVSGHMLIDPSTGGSWGNSLFQNVTVNTNGTASPNALGTSVANGTSGEASNFTGLKWEDDTFVGTIMGGPNMIDVENSTFWGGIDPLPSVFRDNFVYWADQSPNRLTPPIATYGAPTGGLSSVVVGNTFVFPAGIGHRDPFLLTVPYNIWTADVVEMGGDSNDFLLSGSDVEISANSTFSQLEYVPDGSGAPAALYFFDTSGSTGFSDAGAAVWQLDDILENLPVVTPSPAGNLHVGSLTPTALTVSWSRAFGPVTNYSVVSGPSASDLYQRTSAGNFSRLVIAGLASGQAIYFEVIAWNGSHPSNPAGPVFAITPVWAPGVPPGLTVLKSNPLAVEIAWLPATGNVTNYTVFLGTGPASLDTAFAAGMNTTFNVTGLAPSTRYYVSVEAWNLTWGSGLSAPIVASTVGIGGGGGPGGPGPSGFALGDWANIAETLVACLVAVVGPIAALSKLRSGRRRYA